MTIKYLDSKRLEGVAGDLTATPVIGVGGWKEIGRTTLGAAADIIDVGSLTDKRYYMVLGDIKPDGGNIDFFYNLNGDTGGNFASRRSEDGGTDSTVTSNANGIIWGNSNIANPNFSVGYFSNLSTKEKLNISHTVHQNTAGAGTAPLRVESVGKWSNTADAISTISMKDAGSDQYGSGSEVVVLGWDPADTHTSNFWEELASVTAVGGTETFETGTFTAKKYLWIQAWIEGDTTNRGLDLYVNSDTGTNYSQRYSDNGGADGTATSTNQMLYGGGNSTTEKFFMNAFIINNSANEKLGIAHTNNLITAGAGTAPTRRETVGKWANTSTQITKVGFKNRSATTGQNITAGSIIKVWGHD